jgi:hypothetical protein
VAMTEVFQLDLDEEILSHLADPDSVNALWADNLNPALIEDDFAEEVWLWTVVHMREHGRPPTPSVLADEFDLEFEEPLTTPGDLMDRLRERFMRNEARREMTKLGEVYKENPAAVPDLMLKLGRELSANRCWLDPARASAGRRSTITSTACVV